jgi:hypothetical protein
MTRLSGLFRYMAAMPPIGPRVMTSVIKIKAKRTLSKSFPHMLLVSQLCDNDELFMVYEKEARLISIINNLRKKLYRFSCGCSECLEKH